VREREGEKKRERERESFFKEHMHESHYGPELGRLFDVQHITRERKRERKKERKRTKERKKDKTK